jgi:hypothetical protein
MSNTGIRDLMARYEEITWLTNPHEIVTTQGEAIYILRSLQEKGIRRDQEEGNGEFVWRNRDNQIVTKEQY